MYTEVTQEMRKQLVIQNILEAADLINFIKKVIKEAELEIDLSKELQALVGKV